MFFSRRIKNSLDVELAGLKFSNPVGVIGSIANPKKPFRSCYKAGFVVLTPPGDAVLEWISNLQEFRKTAKLAVNLSSDIVHTFSLIYDFADFIIIDPDTDSGLNSPDLSDITFLLDEIVSLRLCYEQYTPIFLRLSRGDTPDEIAPLLSCARLSGLDGIVAPTPLKVRQVMEECQGRMPVIGIARTAEEGMEELQAGATLIETDFRPLGLIKMLKRIENQTHVQV